MKKIKIILLTILGIANWCHSQEAMAAQLVDVAVVQANNDAIALELVGKVQTKDEIILSSYVDAHLTKLLLPGTKLHKGQVVAQMDTEFLIIQRDLAAVELERLTKDVYFLDRKQKRNNQLKMQQSISQETLDSIERELVQAKFLCKKNQLLLDELERKLELATMVSDGNYIVAERYVSIGDYINVGERIARLMPLNNLEVVAQVPVEYLDILPVGKTLKILNDQGDYNLVVERVLNVVMDDTQSIRLFMVPQATENKALIVGLQLVLDARFSEENTVLVPMDAVIPRKNSAFVYVLAEDNVVEKQQVKILASTNKQFVLTGNIEQGDKLIIRGMRRVKAGDTVEVKQSRGTLQ
jgi:RND family efflux transporter MFP subunit